MLMTNTELQHLVEQVSIQFFPDPSRIGPTLIPDCGQLVAVII